MTIVVTGAGGFVGRALVASLAAAGHRVTAVDQCSSPFPAGVRSVIGDLAEARVRDDMLRDGCSVLIHLAALLGAAAEADAARSHHANIETMQAVLKAVAQARAHARPRVVYASSIAVLGGPLDQVDDTTPLAPVSVYGIHKAMMETVVARMHDQRRLDGITVRLPAVVARPPGGITLKSAFISDVFHAIRAHQPFICPVSAEGTIWAASVAICVRNLEHAIIMDSALMPVTRAVTLPALRPTMGALVAEIARQCGSSDTLVSYRPDAQIQAAFASQPALATPAAERAGFVNDGDLRSLVRRSLAAMSLLDEALPQNVLHEHSRPTTQRVTL